MAHAAVRSVFEYVTARLARCGNDRVLSAEAQNMVDDFLASGSALEGLMELVGAAGAELAGVAIAIEKCFQGGGDEIRSKGVRIESLALIESMDDEGGITFRPQPSRDS